MFLVTYGALKCFKKHIARLQTTKVAKHPEAGPAVLTRVGLQILTKHHNSGAGAGLSESERAHTLILRSIHALKD